MNATKVPNYLIVGAGRCGTTALAEGLRLHPSVFVTRPKEPNYWALHGTTPAFTGPGDDASINSRSVTELREYLNLFASATPVATALGDASVSSLYYFERSIPEVLRVNAAMKIIIMLRDPVDRAYSAFSYMRAREREPENDFLAAWGDEDRRVEQHWHHLWHYRRMSLYNAPVSAFYEAFAPENIRVVFYDDLQRDYPDTLAEILDFLNVPQATLDIPRVNVSGVPRSRQLAKIIRLASTTPGVKQAVRGLTTRRLRESIRTGLVRRPDGLSDQVRQVLQPAFADDLRMLAKTLEGQRVPVWLERARLG